MVHRVLGKLANEIGIRAEEKAVEALLTSPIPFWIIRARRAKPEEDHKGIDIVVFTDVGKLYIQVKSSKREVRRFRSAHPNFSGCVVCIPPGADLTDIKLKLLRELNVLRNCYLNRRSDGF